MSLCTNCKEYKKNGVVKVGIERSVTKISDMCKQQAETVDILDTVTGKRYIPNIESVLCRNINLTGTCPNYDEKSGGLDEPEAEIEIGDSD